MCGLVTRVCPAMNKDWQSLAHPWALRPTSGTNSNSPAKATSNCFNAFRPWMTCKPRGSSCCFVPAPAATTSFEQSPPNWWMITLALTTPQLPVACNNCSEIPIFQPQPWPQHTCPLPKAALDSSLPQSLLQLLIGPHGPTPCQYWQDSCQSSLQCYWATLHVLHAALETVQALQASGWHPPTWQELVHGTQPPHPPATFLEGPVARGWQHTAANAIQTHCRNQLLTALNPASQPRGCPWMAPRLPTTLLINIYEHLRHLIVTIRFY